MLIGGTLIEVVAILAGLITLPLFLFLWIFINGIADIVNRYRYRKDKNRYKL